MFGWLGRLSDGSYESEEIAGAYHTAHAVFYGLLIGGYVAMIAFHLAAARRHLEAAKADLHKEDANEIPPGFV